MKNISIRLKITLWFSTILVVIVGLTYLTVFYVSKSVIQKTIQDNLIETVEYNVDEVEYFSYLPDAENDKDADYYIVYKEGLLEVDDDYLDQVNGIATALYTDKGVLLYGENPIATATATTALLDGKLQRLTVRGTIYYLFDRQLTADGLDGLWLRGVVSEEQGTYQLSSVVNISLILLPLLVILAVLGGYLIARKALQPIKQITIAASTISHGRDLKKRIALGAGNDELHRLANTFDEMFDRLDDSFEAERQFTSDASHELRTPVSVINAQCEYILEEPRTTEEYEEAFRVIERQSRKMTSLIEEMLSFTRLECKTENYPMQTIDLSELTKSISKDLASLHEKNITLHCQTEDKVMVHGNAKLLTSLLINLISNAYRYGKENGYIQIMLQTEDDMAKLSVTDNGIGIASSEQNKIFNRFYQVDASRSQVGTGLGLSMVQEIASLHHGHILVDSEPGKGSTFTFILKKE